MNIDLSAARRAGVTNLNQIDTLIALRKAPMPMGDISVHLRITSAATTCMIDRMEKAGLVTRVRTSLDRRMIHIRLTERGAEIADTLLAPEPSIP